MSKVVLGGGLSGLSSAYYLLKRNPKSPITLLESSNRLGGWIKTNHVEDKVIFEQAARTLRPRGEPGINTLSLIEELGLGDQIIPILSSSPAAKNRMVFVNKKLISLPSKVTDLFVNYPPFTKPLIWHLLNDLHAPRKLIKDDSVYNFIHRRFGEEFADYLISPLICGICAGDAKEISVNFLMKSLFDYEQKYGNVTKGIVYSVFNNNTTIEDNALSCRAKQEKWSVYSFKKGLESLPKALERKITASEMVDIKLNVKCEGIKIKNDEVLLILSDGTSLRTKHIISAIPSNKLSDLIKPEHPDLALLLNNIKYVTVCVINLLYNKKLIKKDGFGFLVPPKEKIPILGVIYDSCCFPTDENKTVLTVMMGGHWFNEYFGDSISEEELLKTAKEQLKITMGINELPASYKVNVLKNCIPQYIIGHNENLEKINEYIAKKKLPISLCGAAYHGVGVNDVIFSAKKAVEGLL